MFPTLRDPQGPRLPVCQRLCLVLCLCFCLAGGALAQAPAPLAGDFEINSYTPSIQSVPEIGVAADGSYVVTFASSGSWGDDNDGFDTSVQARFFAADGTPAGPEFQVNSYTTGNQPRYGIAIAPRSGGDFVVVWDSSDAAGDASGDSVHARLVNSAGPVGAEFQVNTLTVGDQKRPAVAVQPGGGFVVAFESDTSFGNDDNANVQARLFDSTGNPLGPEFQVNAVTDGYQQGPAVGTYSDGSFLVAWSDDSDRIKARRYLSDGTPDSVPFQVNTHLPGSQESPSIAVADDDWTLIVWESGDSPQDTDLFSVQARLYAADGTPVGNQFQVNSWTEDNEVDGHATFSSNGSWLVTWESEGRHSSVDGSQNAIRAQYYAADGTPLGDELAVNSTTSGAQTSPAVASLDAGRWLIAFSSEVSPGIDPDRAILGRILGPAQIFADGFESGDTSAWSQTVD